MPRRLSDQERIWRSVPESDVIRDVLDYVARRRGYAWRQNTGAGLFRNPGSSVERYVQFAERGACDIIAVVPRRSGGAVVLFIECKTELGKQSEDQIAWQAEVEMAGGNYFVVRPSTWKETIDAAVGVL